MKRLIVFLLFFSAQLFAQIPSGNNVGDILVWNGSRWIARTNTKLDSLINLITGDYQVYKQGSRYKLRGLKAGSNITMTVTDTSIIISSTAGGGGAGGGTLDTIRQDFGITATRVNDSVYTIAVDSSAIASVWDLSQYEPKISGSTPYAIPYTDDAGDLRLYDASTQYGVLSWDDNSFVLNSSVPTALGGTANTSYTSTEFLMYSELEGKIMSSGYDATDFLGSSATAESAKSAYWATKVRSDSVKSASKADSVTSPNTAKKTSDNNFTIQQTIPSVRTDSIMTLTNMLTIYNEAYFKIGIPDSTLIGIQGWTEDDQGKLTRSGDLSFYTTGDSGSSLRRWSRWDVGRYTDAGTNYQTSLDEYAMRMQIEAGYNGGSFWLGWSPDQIDDLESVEDNEIWYAYAGDLGQYMRVTPELRLLAGLKSSLSTYGTHITIERTGTSASTCTIDNTGGLITSDYNGTGYTWEVNNVEKMRLVNTSLSVVGNTGYGNLVFNPDNSSYGPSISTTSGTNNGILYLKPYGGLMRMYDGSTNMSFDMFAGANSKITLNTNGSSYFLGGNFGVGISPSYTFDAYKAITTAATTTIGFNFLNSITFASDNAQQIRSLNLENAVNDGSYDVGSVYGIYAFNRMNWRNDAANVTGIFTVGWYGANTFDVGTTTSAYGLDAGAVNHFTNIASGIITTASSIIARNQTLTTGDSITITYARGITAEAQTKGTNNTNILIGSGYTGNWSIYNNSTYDNYFAGKLAIGTNAPATSAALDVSSTTGALIVPRMTTTQRDALTAVNGMIIYNTTTNAFNFYENSSWVTK